MPYWRLSGVYFTYFLVVGALFPYWSLYLDHLGFDARSIGILCAIPLFTKIISPNIWGWLADVTQKPLAVIRFGALGGVIGFLGVIGQTHFIWLVVFIFCYSFFWNAILAQFEVVTLHFLGDKAYLYSRIRVWGSIGFVVAVLGLGLFFKFFPISYLAPIILLFLFSIFAFSFSIPALEKKESDHSLGKERGASEALAETGGFRQQLIQADVVIFFAVMILLNFSHGTYYTFYSIYLQDHGFGSISIGVAWSIGVIAEIVLFWFMPDILKRLSLYVLLVGSLALAAIRWWAIGWLAGSEVIIWGMQFLHAASFGVTHAVSIEFIRQRFNSKTQGQAQAFYSAIPLGAGGALGAYIAGELWGVAERLAFGSSALAALVGCVLTAIFLRAALRKNPQCG